VRRASVKPAGKARVNARAFSLAQTISSASVWMASSARRQPSSWRPSSGVRPGEHAVVGLNTSEGYRSSPQPTGRYKPSTDRLGKRDRRSGRAGRRVKFAGDAVELAVAINVAMITAWSAPRYEIATSPKKIPAPDGHWTRIDGETLPQSDAISGIEVSAVTICPSGGRS
jgi:hypothetical protein